MEVELITINNTTKDNTVNFGLILNKILSQIKLLHWYSCSYDSHLIFGELYDTLDDLFDKIQEEIIGTSKTTLNSEFPEFSLENFKDCDCAIYTSQEYVIQEYYNVCNKAKSLFNSMEFKSYVDSVQSGIGNTKEEIITAFNKASYLLSLNQI